jgi:hypothetical protein
MGQTVLWIRIRKNPRILAGSESEKKVLIQIQIRIQTLFLNKSYCEKLYINHLK